jgi:OOP family OmpA-OmpF porin
MIRKSLLTLLLLTVSATASAEAPKSNGAYLGISAGVTLADADGAFFFEDDQDTTVQLYLGYKFIKYFALEARIADFGSYSDGFDSIDISTMSIHAIGIIPFGESGWEMFGQIGAAKVEQSVAGFGSDDDSAATLGLGVRWHINPKIAVAIQVDAYVWQNSNIGSEYDLSVGAETLSFQVNF